MPGLTVGTYRYVVATLSLPARWVAYIVGFGGDKSKGLHMIEEAARYPGDMQIDAKFALMLLYNREGRFEEALAVIRDLMTRLPRNRVLRLEAGATAIRARQYSEADRLLTAGIEALPADPRPRAFGEEAMWFYKRGLARLALRRLELARADLKRAFGLPMRVWVKARVQLEFGKLADLESRRADAQAAYREAIRLGEAGNDPETADEARRWMRRRIDRPRPSAFGLRTGCPDRRLVVLCQRRVSHSPSAGFPNKIRDPELALRLICQLPAGATPASGDEDDDRKATLDSGPRRRGRPGVLGDGDSPAKRPGLGMGTKPRRIPGRLRQRLSRRLRPGAG